MHDCVTPGRRLQPCCPLRAARGSAVGLAVIADGRKRGTCKTRGNRVRRQGTTGTGARCVPPLLPHLRVSSSLLPLTLLLASAHASAATVCALTMPNRILTASHTCSRKSCGWTRLNSMWMLHKALSLAIHPRAPGRGFGPLGRNPLPLPYPAPLYTLLLRPLPAAFTLSLHSSRSVAPCLHPPGACSTCRHPPQFPARSAPACPTLVPAPTPPPSASSPVPRP